MKVKQRLNIILLFLISNGGFFISNAQTPGWQWAKGAGGGFGDGANSVATDNSGNVFVTGFFASPTITFGTTTLTKTGNADMFIVKYNNAGSELWAKSVGCCSSFFENAIATDVSGNILVTGSFDGPMMTFGTDTLYNSSMSWADMFIVKFDPSGNFVWAKSAGGSIQDVGYSVATDTSENVLVTGYFISPSITFGSTTLTNINPGSKDMFVVKYDSNGAALWAQNAGGNGYDIGKGVVTDGSGNVFVTGSFDSPSITFGSTTLNNAFPGSLDLFIAKYDAAGNLLWAERAGENNNEEGNSIAIDNNNNVLVTGSFNSDSITIGTTVLVSVNKTDMFIAKYSNSGSVLWAKSAGGSDDEIGKSVTTDNNGNVIVVGDFWGTSINFGTSALNTSGLCDIFIVKYDASGIALWSKGAVGGNVDNCNSVALDDSGNVFVAGFFDSPTISFGTNSLNNSVPTYTDMYVAKLDNTSTGIAGNSNYADGIIVFPNPVSGKLHVSFYNDASCEILLYDMQSRIVLKQKFINSAIVNVEELAKGIYFYEMRNNSDGAAGVIRKGKIIKD